MELQIQEALEMKEKRKRRKVQPHELTPYHTQYWADNSGTEGGDKPWKFSCKCGEVCSSFENFRYHPTGRMFECTRCSIWSHVSCILGNISDEVLEEIEDALCAKCHTEVRRRRLAEMRELNLEYRNGEITKQPSKETESGSRDTAAEVADAATAANTELVTPAEGTVVVAVPEISDCRDQNSQQPQQQLFA
jgi:hypothetical protein